MRNAKSDYEEYIASLEKECKNDPVFTVKYACELHHDLCILKKYNVISKSDYISLRNDLLEIYQAARKNEKKEGLENVKI